MSNSILLISDDKKFANDTSQKLIFLRNNDCVTVSDYQDASFNVKLKKADIVLIHENSSKNLTLDLIASLRQNSQLCIILLCSTYDSDFILSAYDCGIDDFAFASAENFELVIRTVNNIKHNSIKLSALKNNKILEQIGVIDDVTGFYNYKYAKQVIENILLDNYSEDSTFIVLTPSNSFKQQFSTEKMADAVKASVRISDVVTLGKGAAFYILLTKTDINGALIVLNKIKENYGDDFELCSGIVSVQEDNFDKLEHKALHALSNSIATNAEYIIAHDSENTLDNWLGDSEIKEKKNYKIFRQMFNKKLEKVITPVFYSLQNAWEEKLFGIEIEQFTNSEQCVFRLKHKNQESTLRIIYPGFAKIIISIVHEGLDSPENTEIQLPLAKITRQELVNIVEEFIREFKLSV